MSWLSTADIQNVMRGVDLITQRYRLRRHFNDCHEDCNELANCMENDLCCHNKSCYEYILRSKSIYNFGGVYAADQIPSHVNKPVTYIINSDPIKKPGKHWMAYYQDDDVCEFFDSYGFPSYYYPTIDQWLKKAPKPVKQLNLRIQGPAPFCGAYCYFYLTQRPFARNLRQLLFHRSEYQFRSMDWVDGKNHEDLAEQYLKKNDDYIFNYLYSDISAVLRLK